MSYAPEPDLFIRTGGGQPGSPTSSCGGSPPSSTSPTSLWPGFDAVALDAAIASYAAAASGGSAHQRAGAGGAGERDALNAQDAPFRLDVVPLVLAGWSCGPPRAQDPHRSR